MITLKDLFSSKKFLVMLAGIVVMIADKIGLNLDPDLVNKMLGLMGAYIIGQGIADHGKEKAKVEAAAASPTVSTTVENVGTSDEKKTVTTIEAAASKAATLLVLLFAGVTLISTSSCGWLKSEGAATGKAAVSCLTSTAKSQITQYGPVVEKIVIDSIDSATRQVDWAPVTSLTKNFAMNSGMCVLADVVGRIIAPKAAGSGAPQTAPIDVDADSVLAGFHAIAGGQAYETKYGTIQ